MKRLVIVDLDQTLLDSPKQKVPSVAAIQVVQEIYPEVLVGFATGRVYSWTLPVLKAVNFTAPCIIGGGASIVDPQTHKVVSSISISSEGLNAIKAILVDYPALKLLFNDYTDEDYLNGGWGLERFFKSDSCEIIDIIGLSHTIADKLIQQLGSLPNIHAVKMNGYHENIVDILVTNKEATKTNAIRNIQHQLTINKDNTIGIGNGYNDVEIFEAVGLKVAVGNAVDELKQKADLIIDDVTTDPVPSYLRQLKFR